jgi:hypothetical protein
MHLASLASIIASAALSQAQAEEGPEAMAPPADGGMASKLGRLLLLPDISAIGNFALAYHTLDLEGTRSHHDPIGRPRRLTPQLQEVELAFQSVVDPYARADIFLSIGGHGIEVEEAYLTSLSLPAGFQVKVGSYKSPLGRVNAHHLHTLDFVDPPLMVSRLFGEEGMAGPGTNLAWLAPLPWFAELHLSGQAVGVPEEGHAHGTEPAGEHAHGSMGGRGTGIARLIQFFDPFESLAVGFGLSAARSDLPGEKHLRDLAGVDLYLKFRPPAGRAFVALQAEAFALRMVEGSEREEPRFGGYSQLVWQPGRHFAYAIRHDWAPPSELADGVEHRASAAVSLLPSEFQRIRLQGGQSWLPGGDKGWEAFLQVEFSIGAHGAHPF